MDTAAARLQFEVEGIEVTAFFYKDQSGPVEVLARGPMRSRGTFRRIRDALPLMQRAAERLHGGPLDFVFRREVTR